MTNGQETAHLIEDVQKAGGLTTREEEDLFVKHLEEIRHEGLTPEEYHKQVQELVRMYDPREDAAPTTTPESTTPLPPQESTETLPSDALGTQPQPQTPPVEEFESLPGDPSKLDDKKLGIIEDSLLEKIQSEKTSPEERIAAENDMQRIADVRIERNKGQKYVPVNTSVPEDAQIRPDLPSNTTGAQINPPMDAPERPVEVTRVSAGGESTYLQAVKHETPLEEMSAEKREKLRAKIIAKMDQLNVADPKQAEKHSELGNDLATLEAVGQQGNSGPLVDPAVKAAREERAAEGDPVADIDPKQYAKDYRTKLRDMTDEKLRVHGQETAFQIDGNPDPDAVKMLSQRLDKIKEERANRYLSPGGGLTAQIPPTIGGGVAGFIGGWASPADDEKERWEHAWLGALAGAAGGKFLSKYNKQVAGKAYDTRTAAELPGGEWQAEIQKHVVTGYEAPKRQLGFLEKMRTAYFQIVHRSAAGERFTESIGANNLATARNPGKLMAMYGRWTAMSEAAFKYGPSLVDEFGNTKHLGASSPHDILDSVGGDVETLGQLMAARTKVEMGESVKTPFDIVAATNFFKKAPEVFHKAADAARQLSLAMADVAVDAGLLSKNGREAFANETMYAALMRVFKYDSAASSISAEKGQAGVVGAQNPLRGRTGGSKDAIKNPFESMYEMIPRMYRAAELNKIKGSFIDAWEAADKPKEWMQRISGKESGNEAEHQAYVKALKAEIQMTDADAHAMVAGLDPDAINIKKGTMRVYRNGVVQTYKIHPDLAQAMLSLNPDEMHWVTRALGAPARLASTGIVLNPFFVAKMGFFDMFQATANSQYGFRFGIDNMRGYWNIVNQSSKYKKLLGAGLSHQGLSSVGTTLATSAEGFRQQAGAPMEIAVRALKEARPLDFYKALISPVADAARVGEALRALDHGASDIDAVFAAKHVTGNYSEIGAWSGMRGLQHMTMFLGPAFQILDTAAYRGGVHLFRVGEAGRVADFSRYAIKSMLMIGLPSYYFWHKAESEDDQQIRDLRSSAPTNWYYRLNWDVKGYGNKGDIVKIPKPILDGQIFGTSVESALDHQKGNDPINMAEFSKAVGQQAAFNLLPTVGVIPLSLQANQDMSSGWAIEPQGDQNLPTEMRGADKATWMSRTLSHAIAPKFEGLNIPMLQHSLSPAGMDFLFNAVGGMLGQDAVKSVSQAMEYQETGYIPSKEEYPIMKQVFVQNPLRSTKEIERFYQGAGPVEQVGAAISHMMKEDPESLLPYMERHQKEYALVGMYAQARTQMAGFRRAINDLRNVHTDVISSQQRRETIAEYLDMMNERAKMVNEMAKDY